MNAGSSNADASATITALVIAAGSSRRLGRPKQLLPFRGATLLDATLSNVRAMPFAARIVTVGAASVDVTAQVDTTGFDVVTSSAPEQGCSSSIVTALATLDATCEGIVLFLGDQPDVSAKAVAAVIEAGKASPIAVCNYDDGVGHPFWFGRAAFDDLAFLRGDKAIWKLIESGRFPVGDVKIAGTVPLDVDTEADYERILAAEGATS